MNDGALLTPTLATMSGPLPLRGQALDTVEVVTDGGLAWRDGVITYTGPASGLDTEVRRSARSVEGAVIPGFVDCHTHLPFFGWRADEFRAKLAGQSYRDVHGGGGGIDVKRPAPPLPRRVPDLDENPGRTIGREDQIDRRERLLVKVGRECDELAVPRAVGEGT